MGILVSPWLADRGLGFFPVEFLDKGTPPWEPVILLGDFNAHVGKNSENWKDVIGRNCLPDLNLSGALLLYFCAN